MVDLLNRASADDLNNGKLVSSGVLMGEGGKIEIIHKILKINQIFTPII
jgi:hypothetical protein